MAQLNHILIKIMGLRGVISATKAQKDRLNVSS
jgi:hypothetical protein